MIRFAERLRQVICLHWFDASVTNEFTEYVGHVVCNQQRMYRYTQETRTCSRCGLVDGRRVGKPVFEGWD